MILVPLLLRRRPPKVIAGAGLMSRTLGAGKKARTVLYTSRGATVFAGAWYVSSAGLQGAQVEALVAPGFVNALEPVTQDGVPLSGLKGGSKGGVIKGAWREGDEQWVVLKVKIDLETGKMVATDQESVAPDNLVVEFSPTARGEGSGEYGYAPLAYIKKMPSGMLETFQIAYFSYRHNTAKNQFGGNWRHFFHAA
jgi:hypothetical protein